MLTLYVKTGCPYSARVLKVGEELGLTFNLKYVDDERVMNELISLGGKERTPYFIDEEKGVSMYESDAIVDYLHERFK